MKDQTEGSKGLLKGLRAILQNAGPRAMRNAAKTIRAGVSVDKTPLPLHLTQEQICSGSTIVASNRATHHMAMQEMAGTNWQGAPRGFRISPTSRKNPEYHAKGAVGRLERLVEAAGA